jgi:hypothetical protein
MPRISDTGEVRAALKEWAEDMQDPYWAERAHEAYLSMQRHPDDGYFVIVDARMLRELKRRVPVQELPVRTRADVLTTGA